MKEFIMMTDISNPWMELESDFFPPSSFPSQFPLPLQEVKVETEDSEPSASSFRESGDLQDCQNTYISLDSYEQISSPPSSYSNESLSPLTTNSDNSVTPSRYVDSTALLTESSPPHNLLYSPVVRPQQCRTPSEYLNPPSSQEVLDSPSLSQLCHSMEDHRPQHSSFPEIHGLSGLQHDMLSHDVNQSSYAQWTTTTSFENCDSGNGHQQLRNFHNEQVLEIPAGSRECVNCGSSSAVLWWHDGTGHFLCNTCSQAFKTGPESSLVSKDVRKTSKRTATAKRTSMVCVNCKADKTSLWRRNNVGETVCNACGLYFKLHKCNRPITMKKDSIQKRKRKPKASEEKPKGRSTRSLKERKFEDGSPVLSNPAETASEESVDVHYPTGYSDHFDSHHLGYVNSIRLLPPVYSSEGFRRSISLDGSYIASTYSRSISPLSSLHSRDNLPSVDVFQGRADYPALPSQSSILSSMPC